jgi:hypothetical protein
MIISLDPVERLTNHVNLIGAEHKFTRRSLFARFAFFSANFPERPK